MPLMRAFALAVVLALLSAVSAQKLNRCSPPSDNSRLTITGWRTHSLSCGSDIEFPSFKQADDSGGPAVVAVNAESLASVDQAECDYLYQTGGVKSHIDHSVSKIQMISLRNGPIEDEVTFVPENKSPDDGATFSGPINKDHKKWGTGVMNGCSLVVWRVGNDFYISHPTNGFSIRQEITGADTPIVRKESKDAPATNVKSRGIITPVPMTFDWKWSQEDNIKRNSHVWGQWKNNKLEVYVGQFVNNWDKDFEGKNKAKYEDYLRFTNGPTREKLDNMESKVLTYDHCYKAVFSSASLQAEDAPPKNLVVKKEEVKQESKRLSKKGSQKQLLKKGHQVTPKLKTSQDLDSQKIILLQTRFSLPKRA